MSTSNQVSILSLPYQLNDNPDALATMQPLVQKILDGKSAKYIDRGNVRKIESVIRVRKNTASRFTDGKSEPFATDLPDFHERLEFDYSYYNSSINISQEMESQLGSPTINAKGWSEEMKTLSGIAYTDTLEDLNLTSILGTYQSNATPTYTKYFLGLKDVWGFAQGQSYGGTTIAALVSKGVLADSITPINLSPTNPVAMNIQLFINAATQLKFRGAKEVWALVGYTGFVALQNNLLNFGKLDLASAYTDKNIASGAEMLTVGNVKVYLTADIGANDIYMFDPNVFKLHYRFGIGDAPKSIFDRDKFMDNGLSPIASMRKIISGQTIFTNPNLFAYGAFAI